MNDQLAIKQFGPIQHAAIEIRDLTIFVGSQATGKSLAAQLLYFFRGLEDILAVEMDDPLPYEGEKFSEALSRWLGNPTSIYTTMETEICWQPHSGTKSKASWTANEIEINAYLKQRINNQDFSRQYNQVYIPAGRTLYSFVPPYTRQYLRSAQKWPGYALEFYETLGETIRQLWQNPNPREDIFLQKRIDAIFKGKIEYGPDDIRLQIGQKHLNSATMAAGQMEMWPFWAILEASIQEHGRSNQQIVFEEPEAHLHPYAQHQIMEMIAYLVRNGMKFVITTHSPYILYAVNNFLLAREVIRAEKKLPENFSAATALNPKQVAAYRFSSDGHVKSIMDEEVNLIDESELNDVANNQIEIFSQMQAALEATE